MQMAAKNIIKMDATYPSDSAPLTEALHPIQSPTHHHYKWKRVRRRREWLSLLVAAPLLLVALFSAIAFFGNRDDTLSRDRRIYRGWSAADLNRLKRDRTARGRSALFTTPAPIAKTTEGDFKYYYRNFLFVQLKCKRNSSAGRALHRGSSTDYEDYYSEEGWADRGDHSQFPPDYFSLKQRRSGAVLLHIFGLVYMFIALAIVCDEFFVPALGVITERLDISEDVAGATFMAAGGSAPEFFTSVIGVFVAQNNVGIGTIVGSATFNILCVLAFCTLFSTTVLHLTWWPLFRDVTFYVASLFMLMVFFLDEEIVWWEALSLFGIYICYAGFMKFNADIENLVKSKFGSGESLEDQEQAEPIMEKSSVDISSSIEPQQQQTTEFSTSSGSAAPLTRSMGGSCRQHIVKIQKSPMPGGGSLQRADSLAANRRRASSVAGGVGGRRQSIPILHTGAMFRNGIMQLMSQTLDPLSEGEGPENGEAPSPPNRKISVKHTPTNGSIVVERPPLNKAHSTAWTESAKMPDSACSTDMTTTTTSDRRSTKADIDQLKSILEEEEEKPLDLSWPNRWHKQAIYLFLAPILFPLWVTTPDVRKEGSKRWFPFTFCGSIFWIAVFSYLMVWWANTIGETFGIPTEVIGLTILAAGTSIPDLITSVIVARRGLGDMAVSSSIGSNIFDACVGLPVPWLLYFIISPIRYGSVAEPIAVSSNGLVCSVGMLFLMLVLLVAAIGICGWQMNKIFGVIMIISYIAFCAISVSLETGRFVCPLRIC